MSPGDANGRPGGGGRGSESPAGQRDYGHGTASGAQDAENTLFGVTVNNGYGGKTVTFSAGDTDSEPTYPAWQRGPAAPRPVPSRSTAVRNTDPRWVAQATARIGALAARGEPFSADDVRRGLLPSTDGAKALGGLFSEAASRGLIECTGFGASRSVSRRGGVVRQWRGRQR